MERADELNLNTVLLPIYWEVIENQKKGNMIFRLLILYFSGIETSKEDRISMVWFLEKCTVLLCTEWVKQDLKRFERAQWRMEKISKF